MKNLHQSQTTRAARKADKINMKKNPKIDQRLWDEYRRLIDASKGSVDLVRGADYHLSHPLGSKNRSTDVYHQGQRSVASKTKVDSD